MCAWLAPALALLVSTSRAGWLPHWSDDVGLVRALTFLPVGGHGSLSALLVQLSLLVPIGGSVARASLVGAALTAVSARLAYGLARRLLERSANTPLLTPPLALSAALAATLSLTWQAQATRPSSAATAAALAVAVVALRASTRRAGPREWLALGGLLGALAAEEGPSALAALVALASHGALVGDLPSRRALTLLAAAGAASAALLLLPSWLRAPGEVPLELGIPSLVALSSAAGELPARTSELWRADLGPVSWLLAVVGGVWAVTRAGLRWRAAGLGVYILLGDLAPPLRSLGVELSCPEPVRLAGLIGLGALSALGVQTAAVALLAAKLPMARPAAVLVVVFQLTLALAAADQSAQGTTRRRGEATELWTDAALAALPPRTLLLLRTDSMAWRLWSARVCRGRRPDLLVVPRSALVEPTLRRRLLDVEPGLASVLRDMALGGQPSEYALSTLADQRPVYVEPDPAWEPRLMEHLIPEAMWLRFAPQPFGRSDRRTALAHGWGGYRRVLEAAQDGAARDLGTLEVLLSAARDQALAFAALGDRQSLSRVMAELDRIAPEHGFVVALRARALAQPTGSLDLRGAVR